MAREAIDLFLRMLTESDNRRFDSYSVRNSVLIISHITFRDCRVHIFSDNLSRNTVKFRKEAPPCISPSKYTPPTLVTQKMLRLIAPPNISLYLVGLYLEIAPKYKVKQSKNGKFPSNHKASPIDFETQISLGSIDKPLQT